MSHYILMHEILSKPNSSSMQLYPTTTNVQLRQTNRHSKLNSPPPSIRTKFSVTSRLFRKLKLGLCGFFSTARQIAKNKIGIQLISILLDFVNYVTASLNHPIPEGFSSPLLTPYTKLLTHSEKVGWWKILMVECVSLFCLFIC